MSIDTVNPRVEALVTQLGFVAHVLEANIAGLTHEDSLAQPQPGGNCINWVVGHIVVSRNKILELLGREPIWDSERASRYERGTAPIVGPEDAALPLEEILRAFDTAQEAILAGLAEISDEELSTMVPSLGGEAPKAVALAGLVFHETYHVGQTGVLRRLAGRAGAIQ